MTPQHPPASMYRTTEGLGLWEHRGKVAAVGVGHSPTARRWDGTPETSCGRLEHPGTPESDRGRRCVARPD